MRNNSFVKIVLELPDLGKFMLRGSNGTTDIRHIVSLGRLPSSKNCYSVNTFERIFRDGGGEGDKKTFERATDVQKVCC